MSARGRAWGAPPSAGRSVRPPQRAPSGAGSGRRAEAPSRGRTPGGFRPRGCPGRGGGERGGLGIPRTRTRRDSPWLLSRSRSGSWAAAPACARSSSSFATCTSPRPARLGALTTPLPRRRRRRTSERSSSLGDLKVSARSPEPCHIMCGGRGVRACEKAPPPHPAQKGFAKHSWNCLASGLSRKQCIASLRL